MKQVGNTILAKGVNHILAKRDNSAWPKGAKLSGFSSKRFIVFEIDSIKENRELFPVVTIIIMEAFINKMRRLKGVRKQLIVEEAWLRHVSLVYDCLTFHSTRWK